MAAASLVVNVEAKVATFQKQFAEATRTAQKFERDFGNVASSLSAHQKRITDAFSSFSGDRIARDASAVAKAVEQVGGASKLTAREMASVNATVTEAIAKYNALGQSAPKSLVDLEAATRKLDTTTTTAGQSMGGLTQTLEGLGAKGAKSSAAMDILSGTFGKLTAAGVAVTLINKLGGAIAGMASEGAQIAPIQDAFERLAEGAGESADVMLGAMHDATRGLVTDFDLMKSANKALLLGLPATTESMSGLAKTATVLGKAMGLDATTAVDTFIKALGRSSPLLLDDLGLTVKVEEANKKYADTMGLVAENLDEAQKKQAFMNEAVRKGEERVKQIGEQSLTLTEHASTVVVTLSNIVTSAIGAVNRAAGEMITSGQNALDRFAKSLNELQKRPQNEGFVDVDALNQALQSFADNAPAAAAAGKGIESLSEKVKRLHADLSTLTAEQKRNIAAGDEMGQNAKQIAEELNKTGKGIKFTEEHLRLYDKMLSAGVKSTKELADRSRELATLLADDVVRSYEATRIALQNYYAIILKANEGIEEGIPGLSKRSQVELSTITKTVDIWQMYLGLIQSVNSQIKLGVDSAPGLSIDPKVLGGDFLKKEAKTTGERFGQELSQAIIGAIQGGGDIGKTIGAVMGSSLGKMAGDKIGTAIGSQFGKALGGMLGPLGAIGGQLLGGLMDKIFGKSKERKDVEAFADSFGGFDKLQKQLQTLPKHADTLWKALTQGGAKSKDAIDAITEAFRLQEDAMNQTLPSFADASAAAEKLGLDVSKIGGLDVLRITDESKDLAAQWEILAKAGADMEQVAVGAAEKFQVMVDEALKWGHKLPEEMRGPLQKMADMGLLTDATGEKLDDLSGIKFEKPLQAAIDSLIVKLDELIEKISGGVGGALRGLPSSIDMDVPAFGSGGIVTRPTLAMVGEAGPEAIVPLSSGGFTSDSPPIVVKTYLDGYQIAEATVPHIPAVVRRIG